MDNFSNTYIKSLLKDGSIVKTYVEKTYGSEILGKVHLGTITRKSHERGHRKTTH